MTIYIFRSIWNTCSGFYYIAMNPSRRLYASATNRFPNT